MKRKGSGLNYQIGVERVKKMKLGQTILKTLGRGLKWAAKRAEQISQQSAAVLGTFRP